MDLSWLNLFNVTVVDVGVFSISVIGLIWMYRELNALKSANAELRHSVTVLQKENEELRTENGELREENAELQQQVLGLQQQVLGLQQQVLELQQQVLELQQQVLELQAENTRLTQQFRDAQSAADKRYNALLKEHTEIQQQFRDAQSAADKRYNALKGEFDRLLKENGEIRQELVEVRQANQMLRTEFDRLSGRYEELKDWVMAGRFA